MRDTAEATMRMRVLVGYLRTRLGNPEAGRWEGLIHDAQFGKQSAGGLKSWARTHNKQKVEVLQAEFDFAEGKQLLHVWTPGVHQVDWNPFGIRFFDEPTRETDQPFDGVHTVGSREDIYVGWDSKNYQVIAYHLVADE